ncbi:protein of unknown function [Cupriavidus taiwanensis]|nr:protein of unknown function [Cupriavidus taiwanensis]
MDAVRFEGEIYLRDIFSLLECNPALLQVFARTYATEYLAESKKPGAVAYTGGYDADEIEYLELTPDWERNTQAGELSVCPRLSIVGVGYVLRQDVELVGGMQYKAGTRIRWSIMYCPLNELLNLPLRFNGKVIFSEEESVNEDGQMGTITSVVFAPSLAQVIHGALWELSFGGDPEQTAEFVDTLLDTEVNADGWTTISAEELKGRYARKDN